ncbi:MAG: AAA family ATPase [Cytophagales bacterium]|nr:AAA family ATPase [Cytophagales bacterium]MDW8383878.1 AAA family ATPase [Flammeovirgaceae bacterium]
MKKVIKLDNSNSEDIEKFLPFIPNEEQKEALCLLKNFLQPENSDDFFILSGSAGTGKTSLAKAICDYLHDQQINVFLCAPTGRASFVISNKTNREARTIHSLIYSPTVNKKRRRIILHIKKNASKGIYIVDESSMISNVVRSEEGLFLTPSSLLKDLITFIKQGDSRNKIIFIGDRFQLPPVGQKDGLVPALDRKYLESQFNLKGNEFTLTNPMRQKENSIILQVATQIRNRMMRGEKGEFLKGTWFSYSDGIQKLAEIYHQDCEKIDSAVLIALKNEDVHNFNKEIRKAIWGEKQALKLHPGDWVILQQNCYLGNKTFYNGESAIVESIDWGNINRVADLHFAKVRLRFKRHSYEEIIERLMLLEVLDSPTGELSQEQEDALWVSEYKHNKIFSTTNDPRDSNYINAFRLRYGYALTCHKAQGGEWDNVFIYSSYHPDNQAWQYTAVTRARNNYFIVKKKD